MECGKCKKVKPFSKNQKHCKQCNAKYRNENHVTITLNQWMLQGIRFESYTTFQKVYDIYINTENCNLCNVEFTKQNKKCLDHHHGNFKNNYRYICCQKCNLYIGKIDRLKYKLFTDLSRYYFRKMEE